MEEKGTIRQLYKLIWHIQTKVYLQSSIEPKYGAFCLNNKVSAHRLGWKYRPKRTW